MWRVRRRGWIPVLNLIYLYVLVLGLLEQPRSLLPVLLSLIPFLWVYWLFWYADRPERRWRWALALWGLGMLGISVNLGAGVYLVYAAAMAGALLATAPPWQGRMVAWLCALGAPLAYLAAPGPYGERWGWGLAVPSVSLLVGAQVYLGHRKEQAYRRQQRRDLELARLAERERIARDLHDLLGHSLSVVTLKAELAGKLLSASPTGVAKELAEIERVCREALAQVRQAVSGMAIPGLEVELGQLELLLASAGIRLEWQLTAAARTPQQEQVLSLGVREAVTNVLRHSRASRVQVRLSESFRAGGRELRLEISDDGRGGSLQPGNGLRSMQARLAELGGCLELTGGPRGAHLALILPTELGGQAALPEWAVT